MAVLVPRHRRDAETPPPVIDFDRFNLRDYSVSKILHKATKAGTEINEVSVALAVLGVIADESIDCFGDGATALRGFKMAWSR